MTAFHSQLRRIRRLLRLGRLAGAVLASLGLAGLLWLLFALADLAAAFESPARVTVTGLLLAVSALVLLAALVLALRVPATGAAGTADRALADPRMPARTALSLQSATAPATPFGEMLRTRTLEEAGGVLATIPARRVLPWRVLRLGLLALVVPAAGAGVFRLVAPAAFEVVAIRLLQPSAELPPYSPLVFTLDPAEPSTVYGGELLIAAEITGGELHHPVECLIRQARSGEVLRLPAFRESASRFSRKLDGLTEPIEIAFACGKARSAWHPVELLLEPNILSGLVRIVPPEYTGIRPAEVPLDTNEIAVIEGSSVTLELTSNRPLGSAELVFTPAAAPGEEPVAQVIEGAIPLPATASFTWTATRPGRITATVRDLRGTPSPRPLELAFRALPDQPPSVSLSSPPRLMMATPSAIIAVEGRAEDDHALANVRFVRTLAGFRDRARMVAPALRDRQYTFAESLDLAELGLEAGQTIELLMEASDHNPSLLGQGSSEISRIQIISDEQYAEYIRSRTTIDQFVARFRAAEEAMEAAREALEELREAIGEGDAEAAEDARAKAAEANAAAADLLEKIAGDFPAFELEKRLRDLAAEQLDDLRENARELENLDPEAPRDEGLAEIDKMLDRLGQRQPQAEQLAEDLEQVRQAAQFLEMAAKFRQIYLAQESLSKRFGTIVEELRQGEDRNRRLLPSLGETQEKNRKALDEFKAELRERIDAFGGDPALAPLVDSALDFLNELDLAEPETLMDAAAEKARAGVAADAFTNAELARALLERLLAEPGQFQDAAAGQAPEFQVPRPDVNANLAQLLEALLRQNQGEGQGQGNQPGGQGAGPGGTGPGGNAMSGYSLDLPVAGPQRMQFDPPSAAAGRGGGDGESGRAPPLPESAESGTLRPEESRQGQSSNVSPESIPEPYRDAVKRYFTP